METATFQVGDDAQPADRSSQGKKAGASTNLCGNLRTKGGQNVGNTDESAPECSTSVSYRSVKGDT